MATNFNDIYILKYYWRIVIIHCCIIVIISVVIMASLRCGFIHTVLTTLTKSLLSFLVHSAEVADTDKTFFFLRVHVASCSLLHSRLCHFTIESNHSNRQLWLVEQNLWRQMFWLWQHVMTEKILDKKNIYNKYTRLEAAQPRKKKIRNNNYNIMRKAYLEWFRKYSWTVHCLIHSLMINPWWS